jgi:hypothetical protein
MVTSRPSSRLIAVASAELNDHVPEAGHTAPPLADVNPVLEKVNTKSLYVIVLSTPSTLTVFTFHGDAVSSAFTWSCFESVGLSLPLSQLEKKLMKIKARTERLILVANEVSAFMLFWFKSRIKYHGQNISVVHENFIF